MNTSERLQWYEAEIEDARKWFQYFAEKELPTCAAVERVRLRRLQQEREQFVRTEAAKAREER